MLYKKHLFSIKKTNDFGFLLQLYYIAAQTVSKLLQPFINKGLMQDNFSIFTPNFFISIFS